MKRIKLTKGNTLIVDDDTFVWLSKHKCFSCGGSGRYAGFCTNHNGQYKTVLVHREIIGAKPGEIVDHINRNPLDCRKANLRIVSHRENILNSPRGEMNGVYYDKRRDVWYARIRVGNGKRISLGGSKNKRAAIKKYKDALCSMSNK